MAWKKGQSGNPKGRPMEEDSLTWMMKEYLKGVVGKDKKTRKQVFIETVYLKAIEEKDLPSIKLIWNYIDGLPNGDFGGDEGSIVFNVQIDGDNTSLQSRPKHKALPEGGTSGQAKE